MRQYIEEKRNITINQKKIILLFHFFNFLPKIIAFLFVQSLSIIIFDLRFVIRKRKSFLNDTLLFQSTSDYYFLTFFVV